MTLGRPRHPEEPPAGDYVAICVTDTGSGMTDEVRAKVFEPFFTTKEVGKGSGLGLSQVLGFAKQSGGGVRIDSRLGEGTSVHIYLPRAEARPRSDRRRRPRPARPRSPRRQHPPGRRRQRGARGHRRHAARPRLPVVEAGSGGAALDLLEREPEIDLMMIDFAMPGMNGAEVARQAQAKRPTLPMLFVTGFADRTALAGVSEAQIIGKPFIDDELATRCVAS